MRTEQKQHVQTIEHTLPEGVFQFQLYDKEACLTDCSVRESVVMVPAQVNGIPVTEIGKKAFFGQRSLKQVILPESIHKVGDWAFASCRNLEIVEFAGKDVFLGKDVFQKCPRIRRIKIKDVGDNVSWLLAAAAAKLKKPYLLDFGEAGSKDWYARFDGALLAELKAHEMEDFARHFVCGEEDSGRKDEDMYQEERRMEKAELAYLRLLHPNGLNPDVEQELRAYLCGHGKGCESDAAWKTLLKNHGMDMEYARIYLELVSQSAETTFDLDVHLKDIGEDYPELKAFLLKGGQKRAAEEDFFAGLNLDF